MTTTVNEPADLDALWGELLFQACASDGPIRDADVRDAIRIYRLKIERAAAERAIGAAPDPALAEKMTRLADSPRSKWHDEVLPNGAGDSWACVPIGDVMDALPPAERAIGAEGLDESAIARALTANWTRIRRAGATPLEVARDLIARLTRERTQP